MYQISDCVQVTTNPMFIGTDATIIARECVRLLTNDREASGLFNYQFAASGV